MQSQNPFGSNSSGPHASGQNPFAEDLAQWMTGAMGLAQSAAEETRSFARAQINRMAAELDLVRREEFDALKALLAAQGERIAALETALAEKSAARTTRSKE